MPNKEQTSLEDTQKVLISTFPTSGEPQCPAVFWQLVPKEKTVPSQLRGKSSPGQGIQELQAFKKLEKWKDTVFNQSGQLRWK